MGLKGPKPTHALKPRSVIDYPDEAITELPSAIGEQIAHFASAVEVRCTIPAAAPHRLVIIAETGGDMNAFPTGKHLVS